MASMQMNHDMSALVGFVCEAFLYGARGARTGKTSGLLIFVCFRVQHHPLCYVYPSNVETCT